jgi:hypothetical protein
VSAEDTARPAVVIERGRPAPEELAALMTVLLTRTAGAAESDLEPEACAGPAWPRPELASTPAGSWLSQPHPAWRSPL